VKGTIHWVSADRAVKAQVRLYETLFANADPEDVGEGESWKDSLNPDSLRVIDEALVEPSVVGAEVGTCYQFERLGYFCVDRDSSDGRLVFNRTVTLKDSWARAQTA
jgi:glutaminyl-tRNA synthetase